MKKTIIIAVTVFLLSLVAVSVFGRVYRDDEDENLDPRFTAPPPLPPRINGQDEIFSLDNVVASSAIKTEISKLLASPSTRSKMNQKAGVPKSLTGNLAGKTGFEIHLGEQYSPLTEVYIPPLGFDPLFDGAIDNVVKEDNLQSDLDNDYGNRYSIIDNYSSIWEVPQLDLTPDGHDLIFKLLTERYYGYKKTVRKKKKESRRKTAWGKVNMDIVQLGKNIRKIQGELKPLYENEAIKKLRGNGWKFKGYDFE